jgi:uncharacterized protein (TIGR03437 family)
MPYVAPAGVINAAGLTPKPDLAAGSVVSVYGASMANAVVAAPSGPLPQTLGGATATIGDRIAPLFFVSPDQVNLQLPSILDPGPYTLTISVQGLPDATANFTVARNAPGIFTRTVGDKTVAVIEHQDGTLVAPDSPALQGELLSLFVTGLGPLSPARLDGLAIPNTPVFNALDPVTVLVGGVALPAEAAFASPGRVAVDEVQFRLTANTPSSTTAQLQIQVGQHTSNSAPLPIL